MFGRTLKAVIAICFIPVVISATKAFFKGMGNLGFINVNFFLLLGGFFSYPVFHILFFKPMYAYALGHETVHVLATWLCGGKVTSFHVSQAGGEVATTKTNLFITLGPYFVPIHTIFLFLLYWVLSNFFSLSRFSNVLIFLAGFTLSFHIFMTIEVMKMRQPDIIKTGYIFSILFIYVINIFVLMLALSFISRDVSFISFVKKTFVLSKDIYLNILGRLFA